MKKTMVVSLALVLAIALSSCAPAIHLLGGKTLEEYNVQVQQATDLITANDGLKNDNAGLTAKIANLTADQKKLQSQKDQLGTDMDLLKTDMANYQKLVCPDYTWDRLINNTRVWFLSDNNPNLVQVEKDTKVNFLITQWLSMDVPEDTTAGYWVLTFDSYSGIALDSANGCVILDPTKWDVAK